MLFEAPLLLFAMTIASSGEVDDGDARMPKPLMVILLTKLFHSWMLDQLWRWGPLCPSIQPGRRDVSQVSIKVVKIS